MVAWALASGADFVNSARGFMFALGCIQALQCHKNTCPTGITTHNRKLQKGLDPTNKAERVAAYHYNITKSVSMIAHSCGAAEPRQLKSEHIHIVNANGFSVPLAEMNQQPLIFIPPEPHISNTETLTKN
jgi:glutamate synthase domain-containing protein 2